MSLLLDALKKAAEKKAAKNAQSSADSQSAGQVGDDSGTSSEEVTKTVGITRTEYDDTDIAKTEVDATEHTNYEPTRYDSTEIEETDIGTTQVDTTVATEYEPTAYDDTEMAKTEYDATEHTDYEPTRYDSTEMEETDVGTTELDTTVATEYDPTRLDETEMPQPLADVSKAEGAEGEPAGYDHSSDTITTDDIEFAQDPEVSSEVDSDALQIDGEREAAVQSRDETFAELDTVEQPPGQQLSGEDQTLYFQDDEALQPEQDDEPSQAAINELTHDDVTEFMGDGLREEVVAESVPLRDSLSSLTSDDTTITNPDSLTLAQIEQGADELQLIERNDDTASWDDGQPEPDTVSQSREPVLDEYGQPITVMGQETTSTAPPVDFDRLTTDETVTIKETTSTQTFAPDNYDRTLLKISDKDASRLFPGMTEDSDAVMTPDHAKRVFQSKSSSVKSYYYKLFSSIAAILLIAILVVGLFQIQEEADEVDMTLLRYKRDPMPGVIKPKTEQKTDLFAGQSSQTNDKTLEVLATATSEGDLGAPLGESDPGAQTDAVSSTDAMAQNAESRAQPSQDSMSDQVSASVDSGVLAGSYQPAVSADSSSQPAPIASKGALSVEVTRRVSDKDQLLQDAYQAYEEGDLERSKGLYDEVIALDQGNRDALLGRAAIFVHDEQFSQAIGIYQDLLVENPKDSMAMASLISVANIDFQSGETEIKKMLREQPDSPYLHFALGNMYGGQQRWNEAQSSYFTALEQKPGDPNYAYNMAVSLEHLGKKEAALGFYQKALDNKGQGLATFDEVLVAQRIEVLAQ